MNDTTKIIFSVIGTGIAILTVTLVLYSEMRTDMRDMRADIREMRGLLIMHIASAHHTHLPDGNVVAIAPPSDLPGIEK